MSFIEGNSMEKATGIFKLHVSSARIIMTPITYNFRGHYYLISRPIAA